MVLTIPLAPKNCGIRQADRSGRLGCGGCGRGVAISRSNRTGPLGEPDSLGQRFAVAVPALFHRLLRERSAPFPVTFLAPPLGSEGANPTNPKVHHKGDRTMARQTKAAKAAAAAATPADAPTRKEKRSMAATLRKHRSKYVHTDGYAGLSINCGDDVADQLKMCEPQRVVRIAEKVLPNIKAGELTQRYAKLNPGQQRMNAGNRIRAALKRGAITKTALKRAITSTK